MLTFSLALAYLSAKKLATMLHVALMALDVGMLVAMIGFSHQLSHRLYADAQGVDAVVGAKGSPLQLVLSSVQHMDIPTGNIPFSAWEQVRQMPMVKQAIPLALGDNYERFRIVGSTPELLDMYGATLDKGHAIQQPMHAVVGADVAQQTGLRIGDSFAGSHGLAASDDLHAHSPYTVVGILKPTGRVVDRLIITSLESVWDIHAEPKNLVTFDHAEQHQHDNDHKHTNNHDSSPQHKHAQQGDITALLVTFSQRAAALSFPREINRMTALQAASPAFELARIMELVGLGRDTLKVAGFLLVAVSLLSVFIGLLSSIRERQYDLVVMRTLGASRSQTLRLVITEGMLIACVGMFVGWVLGHAGLHVLGLLTGQGKDLGLHGFLFLPLEAMLLGMITVLSVLACLIPAWEAYRTPMHLRLQRG